MKGSEVWMYICVQDKMAVTDELNSVKMELHRAQSEVGRLKARLPAMAREEVAQRELEELKLQLQRMEIKQKVLHTRQVTSGLVVGSGGNHLLFYCV